MIRHFITYAPVVAAVAIGCGGDGSGDEADANIVIVDAAQPDAASNCPSLAGSYDLTGSTYQGLQLDQDQAPNGMPPFFYSIFTTIEPGPPSDGFEIDLWDGFSVFSGGLTTGTFPIDATEANFDDCGVCVVVLGNLDANGNVDAFLVANGGTVTIDTLDARVGGTVTGTASNLTLREIDPGTAAEIPGGCTTTVANVSFSATFADGDAP